MRWRIRCIILVLISVMWLFSCGQVSQASIVGRVYEFQFNRIEQSHEGQRLFHTDSWGGNFQLTIRDLSTDGQTYTVNYYGYYFSPYPSLQNSTYNVDFHNNIIYFELNVYDNDNDNNAEYAHVERYPTFLDLADVILVNPDWTNHSGLWDYAVNSMNRNPCVNHNLSYAFKDDLGTFQYLIVVNFLGRALINGNPENVNGTISFAHSSRYDVDGVLIDYQFEIANHYFYADKEWFGSIKFVIIRGATPTFSYPLFLPFFYLLGGMMIITFGVGLGIGVGIGVILRRRHSES